MTKAKQIVGGITQPIACGNVVDVDAQHDVLYAGICEELDDEDKSEMKRFGWRWDDELDCWAIFT